MIADVMSFEKVYLLLYGTIDTRVTSVMLPYKRTRRKIPMRMFMARHIQT